MTLSICLNPQNICTTARVSPNVNDGVWVIVMCKCRCTGCYKCATLVGIAILGETMEMRVEAYRNCILGSILL